MKFLKIYTRLILTLEKKDIIFFYLL